MYFFGTWYEWWQVLLLSVVFVPILFFLGWLYWETCKALDEFFK